MSLMNEVREAIASSHNAIEQTGFSVAMMDGSLSARNYAFGLFQLLNIHQTLEQAIASRDEIKTYFTDEMIRTPAIERDLVALGFQGSTLSILPDTKAIVQTIKDWSVKAPFALLGCLYILEGSRMGSLVIAKPLAKTLKLEPSQTAGIEYHTEGASKTPVRVRQLKEQIDRGVSDLPANRHSRTVQFDLWRCSISCMRHYQPRTSSLVRPSANVRSQAQPYHHNSNRLSRTLRTPFQS